MQFEIHTATWGKWHTDLFLSVALPTLLASHNLPALSNNHKVVYRIYTTPKWKDYLICSSIMKRLKTLVEVEYVLCRNDENYKALNHMDIWHDAANHAKTSKSIFVVVPPDTIWPNCVFENSLNALNRAGTKCVAVPYMLTVSETSVPALLENEESSFQKEIIDISARDLMQLVIDHFHPHLMVLSDNNPHGRPPLELMWPVEKEGFVVRCYTRELFMVDLLEIELTEHFYGQSFKNPDQYYLMRDSDEGFLVGLHALLKYSYIAHADRPLQPFDIAACSLVGANRAPLAWETGKKPILFHKSKRTDNKKWRTVIRSSLLFYHRAMILREALMVHEVVRDSGYGGGAARIISLILQSQDIDFAKKWRYRLSTTFIIEGDLDWDEKNKEKWQNLCKVGNEKILLEEIMKHIIPSRVILDEIVDGQTKTFEALGGVEYNFKREGEHILINGRLVVTNQITGEIKNVVIITQPDTRIKSNIPVGN